MSYQKKCETCGLRDSKQNVCLITGRQVDPAADFCSQHNNQQYFCQICGRQTLIPIIDMTNPDHHIILCSECFQHTGTCSFCVNNNECLFETDPSPIPQYIQKRIQQGPIVSVTNVINPDRIAITCKMGCSCFDEKIGCLRQNGTCGKYKCVLDEVQQ